MTDWVIGLDLGQAQDYSALAAMQRTWWRKGQQPDPRTAALWHQVKYLQRWRLGTPYTVIAQQVAELYRSIDTDVAQWGAKLVVDAGGPGRPVIDLLKAKRLKPIAVTITSGDTWHQREDGSYTAPKRDICSALVVAAQGGDVKIAAELSEAEELRREIDSFGYKINRRTGAETYEGMDDNIHDDLVLAAALALWYSTQQLSKKFPGTRRGAEVRDTEYNPIGMIQ